MARRLEGCRRSDRRCAAFVALVVCAQGELRAAPAERAAVNEETIPSTPADNAHTTATDESSSGSSIVDANCSWPCYVHTFAGVGVGKGLRLNNPFRLQTQLGSTPESLSATATTLDLEVAALLGNPRGVHHGLAVASSIALHGVPQQVIVPSYATGMLLGPRFWWRARLGAAFVTQPDFNVGVEAGTQLVALARAGLGAYFGVVYAQYWGAATDQTQASTIPVLAAQFGMTVLYEVLP